MSKMSNDVNSYRKKNKAVVLKHHCLRIGRPFMDTIINYTIFVTAHK